MNIKFPLFIIYVLFLAVLKAEVQPEAYHESNVNLREEFCKEVLEKFIKHYPLNEKNELLHWSPVVVMILRK